MNNDNLFDDYLDKKLSAGDRNDFNQRIKKDEAFAQSFTEYIEIKLAAQVASELDEAKPSLWSDKIRILIFGLGILAIIIIMFLWNSKEKDNSNLFDEPIALLERGANEDLYSRITEFYEKEAFDSALVYINTALDENPENPKMQLYKGICLRDGKSAKNYDEAIRVFQGIKNSREEQKATYHLALTYYKMNNHEKSKKILNKILENNRHAKYKQAKEFMENG